MDDRGMQSWLDENAKELGVPGVAIGVYFEGTDHLAFHGVTSIDNPLPVDENTLFLYGSTQKTYTATAVMQLVDQGLVRLDDKVRKHIPNFRVKDETATNEVTVLQILNHTSGWTGDAREDTGAGDDAIARFVESMAKLDQSTPLGSAFSYNNAAFNLAGHLIEKVTGKVYETVMKEMLYEPIGLDMTFFFPVDVMSRRFAAGHRQTPDEKIEVARPWALGRASSPAGGFGVSSTIGDQLKWARFHLGAGTGKGGKLVLSKELLDLMKKPTYAIAGSALGDHVAISWFLEDVDGVQTCSHGGDVIGQHSSFVMVPERDFAVAVLTNCDGSGTQLKEQAVKWALEAFLGVIQKDPEPIVASDEVLAQYTGTYETVAAMADITAEDGRLILNVTIKPEAAKELFEKEEDIPEQPPIPLGLLDGPGDRYIVADGVAKGMRGYFARGEDGKVEAVHVGGRLATRVQAAVPVP